MTNTSRTIEITVKPDGSTSLETKGFAGSECQTASRFVEQALGQHFEEQLKPEFYAQTSAGNSVHNSNGE